jgi:threonine dehydrogenase-like Zn-dependent dehydrogenase
MGRHPDRITLAREFGATEVVSERGEEAIAKVKQLTKSFGAHSVVEGVGSKQSMETAMAIVRPGGAVGRLGVPHYDFIPRTAETFYQNVIIAGGPAPARAYIEELMPDVLEGRINPGKVFDRTIGIDQVPEGYKAMNDREAIKVMIRF